MPTAAFRRSHAAPLPGVRHTETDDRQTDGQAGARVRSGVVLGVRCRYKDRASSWGANATNSVFFTDSGF